MSGQRVTLPYARLRLAISVAVTAAWPVMRLIKITLHPGWYGGAADTVAITAAVLSLALWTLTGLVIKRLARRAAAAGTQLDAYQRAWRILAPHVRPVLTAVSQRR